MKSVIFAILMAFLANDEAFGGGFFYRWQGQKMIPKSGSGLSDLSSYLLLTNTNIKEASACSALCTSLTTCKAAMYQKTTTTCTLYSTSPEGSSKVDMTADVNYVTFTVNAASVVSKSGQSTNDNIINTIYYKGALSNSNNPVCWNPQTGTKVNAEELGVQTDNLHDLAMSSSSCTNPGPNGIPLNQVAWFARINNPPYYFCWQNNPALNEWIKIDLQRFSYVTTFRYQSSNNDYYKTFRLDYSYDDVYYRTLQTGSGITKQFDGQSAASGTIVTVDLYQPLFTRYLKFIGIVETNPSTLHCIKFGIDGCPAQCANPLGVSTLEIEDGGLSSSGSSWDTNRGPSAARLNWGSSFGAKTTSSLTTTPANIVVDLFKPTLVSGIQFQGCNANSAWVSLFRVQYKVRAADPWIDLIDDTGSKAINGNSDASKIVSAFFDDGIVTGQFFNVIPLQFTGSVCFKVELLGCNAVENVLPNLAKGKTVTASGQDSTPMPSMPLAAATEPRQVRKTAYQNCTHVPVNIANNERPVLTVDLGSTQTITSVEVATPSASPATSLIPDGLWLFDMIHGGDDMSGNGNHAILGKGLTYGAGVDGRGMGAVQFSMSTRSTILLPQKGALEPDLRLGWSVFTWIWIDNVETSPITDGVSVYSNYFYNLYSNWGFNYMIRPTTGQIHNNFFYSTAQWYIQEASVPFGRWVFVGFTIDCQSGIVRQIVDKRAVAKRYMGCPSTIMPMAPYAIVGGWSAWSGRLACFQVYRRGLDQSEIEQASLCPWLPAAPALLFPLDCTTADVLGTGVSLSQSTAPPACATLKSMTSAGWYFGGSTGTSYLYLANGPGGPVDFQYSFTMLFHIYSSNNAQLFAWLSSSTDPNTPPWVKSTFSYSSPDHISFEVSCRGGGSAYNATVVVPFTDYSQDSRWTYMGYQYDHAGQTISLIIEGEFVQTATINCPNGIATDAPYFRIGRFNGFTGTLSCLQFYKVALNRKQIQSVRRCPMTSSTEMEALYTFNMDNSFDHAPPWNRFAEFATGYFNATTSWGTTWHSGFPWTFSNHGTFGWSGATAVTAKLYPVPAGWTLANVNASTTYSMFAYNQDTTGTNKLLMAQSGPSGAYVKLMQNPATGSLTVSYACAGGFNISVTSASNAFTPNTWRHHVYQIKTVTGDNYVGMYVNGVKVYGQNPPGADCDPINNNAIYYGSDGTYGFNGAMTCFAAYPGAIGQYLAQELGSCPTPNFIEGHQCDIELAAPGSSIMTFSSNYVSGAGVIYNGYAFLGSWVGNATTAGSKACCWQPAYFSTNEFIQADMLEERIVTSIDLQGDYLTNYYVTTFQLSYSTIGRDYTLYIDQATGTVKTFSAGIIDLDTLTAAAYNRLRPVIQARFIRLIPQTWVGGIGLRWSIRGCSNPLCNIELFDADASVIVSSAVSTADAYRAAVGSSYDWVPVSYDTNPYFQLVFSDVKVVTASWIQSSKTAAAWITKYHLLYSLDAINWRAYVWSNNGSNVRIFDGPSTGPDSAIVKNVLKPPLTGLAVRLVVDSYSTAPKGRFSFKGCRYTDTDTPVPAVRVRVGNSNPSSNASIADGQTQCGLQIPAPGIPYNNKATFMCQPPVSGRYVSVVGVEPNNDMVICEVAAYSDNGTNFAYQKTVTPSSDITAADALTLTDGSLSSGAVGTASSSMWLKVDLGVRLPVSKVVLATQSSGWRTYPTFTMGPYTGTCGSSATASCPAGQVIFVHGSWFARVDNALPTNCKWNATCAGLNSQNTTVSVALQTCHLKNSCTWSHSMATSAFGDPCFTVVKIWEIDWMCIDVGDIGAKLKVRVGDDASTFSNNAMCDYVRLSNYAEMVPGTSLTLQCTPPIFGRYVSVEKQSTMLIKFAEIMIY